VYKPKRVRHIPPRLPAGPERTIGDRDRGAGFDVWVRDERKAAFLKGPEAPQLCVEERLVDHVDHLRDEVAPKGFSAVS